MWVCFVVGVVGVFWRVVVDVWCGWVGVGVFLCACVVWRGCVVSCCGLVGVVSDAHVSSLFLFSWFLLLVLFG